jgi:hypothetical protein
VGKQSDLDVFSDVAFVPGKGYRRRELHEQYGGQRQGGISTPSDHPIIFLITGKSGHSTVTPTDSARTGATGTPVKARSATCRWCEGTRPS